MRELNASERDAVSGGPGPLAVLGAVWLGAQAADSIYSAAKAFKEGYEANDKVS